MKKIIFVLLSLAFLTTCFSQKKETTKLNTSSAKLTPQDSALLLQQQANVFIDSLVAKTSIKELQEFLFSQVTIKQYNEAKFSELYDFFVRAKVDAWLLQKQKAGKPPN